MIVVDTNVVSEPLRRTPDPAVLAWLAGHAAEIALTTITVHELLYGMLRLPEGKRRRGLRDSIDALIRGASGRVLAYDEEAARAHAAMRAGGGATDSAATAFGFRRARASSGRSTSRWNSSPGSTPAAHIITIQAT